ncbi:hypothetical protein [Rhizobium sp. L1K21]|uniref:hypothetical protein n=1 Tax=Rhizobium sp. L1K21 TaxID=2954933 RepID=UPI0020937640|nr:hypothetical protein [Rhizobium sp. L1K21]MCO6187782.1 hypothetical protein [Rhizobium sp. L1K21]
MVPEAGKETSGPDYEARDASTRSVLLVGAGLIAGILVSFGVVAGIVALLGGWKPTPAMLDAPSWQSAAFPHLQVRPGKEGAALRRRNAARLEGLGWADEAAGRVHIPIERAMELIAREGWPRQAKEEGGT